MPCVLDASIAACWAFDAEDHPIATLALERIRIQDALVPGIWSFEARNTLDANERRGRLSTRDTAIFLRSLMQLRVIIDRSPDGDAVMTLARSHRLAVYDAAYLELALREAVPLATLDKDLAKAAAAEKLVLFG